MKIAFDNQIFGLQRNGGISRYFVELAKALVEVSVDLDVKIISPLHFNSYLEWKKGERNIYISKSTEKFHFNNRVRSLSTFLARKSMNSFYPDCIHETFYSSTDLWEKKFPRVVTIFDLIREKQGVNSNKIENKKRSIERAKKIICISDATRIDLMNFYNVDSKNVSTIHLGVQKDFYMSHLISDRKKQILFVGQRANYKNFLILLDAFGILRHELTQYQLICFGGGKFNRDEREKIAKLGLEGRVIQLSGDDFQLRQVYQESEIFVSTSLDEGFGLPILEALASGTRVICSDISVYREIGANTVAYFDPSDADSLASVLRQTVESRVDYVDAMKRGIERSRTFTWESCARKTIEVYESVMGL